MEDIEGLAAEWLERVRSAADAAALEQARVETLGRKGEVTRLMKGLGEMAPEERKAAAQLLNKLKDDLGEAIKARKGELDAAGLDARLAAEHVDMSLPPRPEGDGRIHPVSQVIDELTAVFADMGFRIAEGPDIEDDFHNFTALNIPPEHPARQMHDTFYLGGKDEGERMLLRTHTSPVQTTGSSCPAAPTAAIPT
jgi:phenylalanyl-tRNA synthetase alpha chain